MPTRSYKWILLIHQLPPNPSNLRVRIWRKLQQLGAVAIKNSVYALPFNEKSGEDFQWLKQEIESSGGEATIFHADSVEGAMGEEIVALFSQEREKDYTQLAAELDGLTGTIREQKRGGHLSADRLSKYVAELDKLHKELERVVAIDFFDIPMPSRAAATKAYERALKSIQGSQTDNRKLRKSPSSESAELNVADYQGKRWFTRRNLHIDRLASIWLIKRFIDKRPRFHFAAENTPTGDGIRFDMYDAEFTHEGESCTFETLIRRFGLTDDTGLRSLAEIVHDIDLKDNKFNRTEAAGMNSIIRGLGEVLQDDRKLVQQTLPLFEGLYRLLSEKGSTASVKAKDEKGNSGRKSGRGNSTKRK
jgi:hypothetical protein